MASCSKCGSGMPAAHLSGLCWRCWQIENPPPATFKQTPLPGAHLVAADILARRATELLDAMARWNVDDTTRANLDLRAALETYTEIRVGCAVTPSEPDPQVNDWAPGHRTFQCQRGLLTFRWLESMFVGTVQRAFLPSGLMIWGAPEFALVQCQIGTDLQISVDIEPAPVSFFSSFQSYEQIAAAVAEGKEPAGWCTWKALYPGQNVRLMFMDVDHNPLQRGTIQPVMWGTSVK